MNSEKEKIFIVGGAGYIGSVLCENLINEGYFVKCLDRFFFGKSSINHLFGNEKFSISVVDSRLLTEEDLVGADVVIDLSGLANDPSCDLDQNLTEDINLNGGLNVFETSLLAGVKKYIYSSSCSIYGSSEENVNTENSKPSPVSLYAESKFKLEEQILSKSKNSAIQSTILRNATVFGLSNRMRFDLIINIMTAHAYENNRIYILGGGDQWRPLVHVNDVCKAFKKIIVSEKKFVDNEVFNVGSDRLNLQVKSVANIIADRLPGTEIHITPDDPDKRDYKVSFSKIKKVLNFDTDFSIEDGVDEIYKALKRGEIKFGDIEHNTVKYYKYLFDAEKKINALKINGNLFYI